MASRIMAVQNPNLMRVCTVIYMKTVEFNEFLQGNKIEVISLAEASRIISKPMHYTALFLKRDKLIRRAQRGLYYVYGTDEYAIASRILPNSYVSLVSALRFYNITEQIPNTIFIISDKRHKNIDNLNGYFVRFKTVPKSMMYGYGNIDGAFVADPEKAVIDMVYLNEFKEYAEEAIESGRLDMGKLRIYAEMSGRNSVTKRINKISGKEIAKNAAFI